jgi:serine/threonine-protein kinase RsbW
MIAMKEQNISFPASSENVSIVENLIDEICEQYEINEDHYGNILIALTEAVNNAIHHGSKADPKKTVFVSFESHEKELCFTVKDQGKGFDHKNLPDPTAPENIENPNGRGIFLMKHLADKLEFNDNGSTVSLKFKLLAN